MKVSFDYDGTLTLKKIQDLARILVKSGNDVWIITSRNGDSCINNEDMFYTCGQVGITLDKVIFTNGSYKVHNFIYGNFDLHFDNCWDEIEEINIQGGLGVLVTEDMDEVFTEMQYRYNNK